MANIPHGTTVLALRYRDGVVMAGDRQASEGYQVAHRRIEKLFKSDDLSAVGIAGAAGPPWRWRACSRPSSSTTRRWRARTSPSTARPTASAP
jgi:20S proteasome alpha/beta subunit